MAAEEWKYEFCTLYFNVYLSFSDIVKRKTLVLDLDETLIHSHHDGVLRQTVKPGTPADFVLKVNVRVQQAFLLFLVLTYSIYNLKRKSYCVHFQYMFDALTLWHLRTSALLYTTECI